MVNMLRPKFILISSILFFIESAVFAENFHAFSPKEYESLVSIVSEIQKRCPPDQCIVVGIGRSPTPFLAYLQSMDPSYALQLPLTNFKYGFNSEFPALNKEQVTRLFDHFDRYLKPIVITHKSILFIDTTETGESIAAADNYLKRYFKHFGFHNRISTVVISAVIPETISGLNIDAIALEYSDPLGSSLSQQVFDSLSAFGAYDVVDPPKASPELNPKYSALVQMFSQFRHYFPSKDLVLDESAQLQIKKEITSDSQAHQTAATLALGFYNGTDLVDLLELAFKSPHEETRATAVLSMASHIDAAALGIHIYPLLFSACEDRNSEVRATAIKAIRELNFPPVHLSLFRKLLREITKDHKFSELNSDLLLLFVRIGPEQDDLKIVSSYLSDPDPVIRHWACLVFSKANSQVVTKEYGEKLKQVCKTQSY